MNIDLTYESGIYYSELKRAAEDLFFSDEAMAGARGLAVDHEYRPAALLLASKNLKEDRLTYGIILLRNCLHLEDHLGEYQEQATRLAAADGVVLDFFYHPR
jgi:hypothetical protein